MAVLFGNLAPEGALVKQAAVAQEKLWHAGRPRVFESEDGASAAAIEGRFADRDLILTDIPNRSLNVELSESEIARRLVALPLW